MAIVVTRRIKTLRTTSYDLAYGLSGNGIFIRFPGR